MLIKMALHPPITIVLAVLALAAVSYGNDHLNKRSNQIDENEDWRINNQYLQNIGLARKILLIF